MTHPASNLQVFCVVCQQGDYRPACISRYGIDPLVSRPHNSFFPSLSVLVSTLFSPCVTAWWWITKPIVEQAHSVILFLPLFATPLSFCFCLITFWLLILSSSNPYLSPRSHLLTLALISHQPNLPVSSAISHPSILPSFFPCMTPSFRPLYSLSLSSRVSAVLNGNGETCLHAYINMNDVNLMQWKISNALSKIWQWTWY